MLPVYLNIILRLVLLIDTSVEACVSGFLRWVPGEICEGGWVREGETQMLFPVGSPAPQLVPVTRVSILS